MICDVSTPTPSLRDVCFDEELIRRYDGRGPRYTSYPTALQFNAGVTPVHYRQHAAISNDRGRPLSLYVHIPFCRSLCYYCGCNKIVTRNADRVARYLDCLEREIVMQADLFDRERQVTQLHFGGGTPTYLDTGQLERLMLRLDDAFPFASRSEREFSIEIDPRTVDDQRIVELSELGFDRLSLGIQDFDPRVQAAVNRRQSADDVRGLLDAARRAGFASVSLDLIYGLPHQSVATFDTTLRQIIALQPDRLAVYNYAHLPSRFKGQRMIDERALPAADAKLDILHRTIDRLTDAGYVYIGMDHFALPDDELARARRSGTLQRNFQGYSTHGDCDLIGLGVSSISHVGDLYAQNETATALYEALIDSGTLPAVRGVELDADDRVRAAVIQALMCTERLDVEAFETRHAIRFDEYFARELADLEALRRDGLIDFDERFIAVTPRGKLLLRNIAMVFDAYLRDARQTVQYSKAI